jgi:excinuclease ABC subunit C
MNAAVKQEAFEEAASIRDQLKALYRIQDIALLNDSFVHEHLNSSESPKRIEGYDISNLGSTDKVGSMVVFDLNGPIKADYRKFNIKTVEGQSDVDSLAEVITRRINRSDWPLPDVFLIDGGRPQVNTVKAIFAEHSIAVPIVGIAKGPERKRNDFLLGSLEPEFVEWVNAHQALLIKVRDEAHRFAITFNRSKRKIKK